MLIDFFKMQAQGNDFVFLQSIPDIEPEILAKNICDRHFGIGADGLVYLIDSEIADSKMIIYNSDGTRAMMCGSALRCAAAHLFDKTATTDLQIETDSGLKSARLENDEIHVNMGTPRLIQSGLKLMDFTGELVDIGNLHYIIFEDKPLIDPHLEYGHQLSTSKLLPNEANVHFVSIQDKQTISMKIWERGAGATLACGTGAASTVFAGIKLGKLDNEVKVFIPGGELKIALNKDGSLDLIGTVSKVFEGSYIWKA
ncbi:MAG TPA: diaminopimelate epimerase [Candidatus Cloacimonetes bacterium]|nr:diaminopimelate epimerase [Candidatus Cloacimonadota bacterium]